MDLIQVDDKYWKEAEHTTPKYDCTSLGVATPTYVAMVYWLGFHHDLDSKDSACNAGDLGSVPGSGRSFGEGNSNPLQYYCLEKSMDRGAWWATVHGVSCSGAWLSDFGNFL